jgi:hypothetical protein
MTGMRAITAIMAIPRFAHFLCRLIKSQVPFSALHLLYERFV